MHLAIWIVTIAVNATFFIIAVNSFMQHPVSALYQACRVEQHRLVLTSNAAQAAFTHTVSGALLTRQDLRRAVSAW